MSYNNEGRRTIMNKLNCWEYMKCGKGPGGDKVEKSGICPIATEVLANGLNNGLNGGRLCWIIAENYCMEEIKCSSLHRKSSCYSCEFRYKVTIEEGLLKVCQTTGVFLANSSECQNK
jgi:hypothetical protein